MESISHLYDYYKCPNTEFFLVRIQENTDQKKTPYLGTFHAVIATKNVRILVIFIDNFQSLI